MVSAKIGQNGGGGDKWENSSTLPLCCAILIAVLPSEVL